jgi:glycosyltransferase involved in cell wall biosynthesis
MKRRIAVWMYGGVGTGRFAQGYPMLERLLIGLSEDFHLTIYSHAAPNSEYAGTYFRIRSAPRWIRSSVLRWLILCCLFCWDHGRKRFSLLLAFWGWPSGWIVTVLGKLLGVKSGVYVLGGDAAGIASIRYGIFHKPVLKKLALWTYSNTSLLLAISHYQEIQLKHYGVSRAIHVIPWGADPLLYKFGSKQFNGSLHFIHVGHLSPVKDQATLIKAFSIISKRRPAILHVLGADLMGGTIQRLCTELGIERNVKFFDVVPYHEMPDHYAWADIMLHTSLSEGQCMALTEAAACGILMAGTKVGLLHDLGDEYGITIDTGDYKTLAEKILDILEKPEQWQKKIMTARQWSAMHDLPWTITQLKKLLNEV